MFSVSRGQRISSRCGAVKSVLCPKRLVTVERPPAIRVYLSVQPQGSRERSHSAPPPAPIPALRSSSLRLSGWLDTVAEPWLTGRRGRRSRRAPEAAASSSCCLGGVVTGKCCGLVGSGTPGRRRFFPDRCVLARCPLNQTRTGLPCYPRARVGLRSWWNRRAGGAKPASSPSPIGGARPRGREQGGEMGSSPPAPPLSPPGTNQEPPLP